MALSVLVQGQLDGGDTDKEVEDEIAVKGGLGVGGSCMRFKGEPQKS